MKTPTRALLALFSATSAAVTFGYAQTTYNATPGTVVTTAGNWSNGLPVVGTNVGTIALGGSIGATINSWQVNQTAGAVTSSSNRIFGAIDASNMGTIWNISGGSLNFGVNNINRGTVGSNYAYQLNVSGTGSVTAGSISLSAGALINVSGGTVALTQLSGGAGNLTLTGGSVTIGTLNMTAGSSNITFGLGTSSLTVTTSFLQDADTNINFLSGSGGSISITSFTATDYQTMWGNGRLDFNGANTGNFGDIFTVSGSTLSLIPEPSAFAALAGLATLGLAASRRRRRA